MVSKVLAVCVAVLVIPSVVLWWFERDFINPGNYMEIVTPLASEPRLQDAIGGAISAEVRDDLDIATMMDRAAQDLPPKSAGLMRILADPMSLAVDSYLRRATEEVVGSEEFAPTWEELNRAAHGNVLVTEGDTVYLELGPIVEAVKADLVSEGSVLSTRIPPVSERYALLTMPLLEEAQRWGGVISVLMFALPILAVILLVVAIWLSRDRFQTVLIASMSTAVGMLALLTGTYVGRSVAAPQTTAVVYDAFAASLRADVRWVLLVSAVAALTTWVLKRRLTDRPGG